MPPATQTARDFPGFLITAQRELQKGMNQQAISRFSQMMRTTTRQRGEWIFVLGDAADNIYFLQKGRMKITSLSADGDEVLHEIVGAGEFFGHTSTILGIPRTTSAQTLETSILGEMGRREFESLLTTYPEISLQLMKSVGLRLKKAEAQLVNVICNDVSRRVREALIDLINEESGPDLQQSLTIKITQQDLANLIGASRQKTWQALKELEDSGVLQLHYRSIFVTSPQKLRTGLAC